MSTASVDELRRAGLVDDSSQPHLTEKGRDWLRVLEDVVGEDAASANESAREDLVMSTWGIFR